MNFCTASRRPSALLRWIFVVRREGRPIQWRRQKMVPVLQRFDTDGGRQTAGLLNGSLQVVRLTWGARTKQPEKESPHNALASLSSSSHPIHPVSCDRSKRKGLCPSSPSTSSSPHCITTLRRDCPCRLLHGRRALPCVVVYYPPTRIPSPPPHVTRRPPANRPRPRQTLRTSTSPSPARPRPLRTLPSPSAPAAPPALHGARPVAHRSLRWNFG